MLVREFAENLVRSPSLDDKLRAPPADLSDADRRPSSVPLHPGRPPELVIRAGPETKVPPLAGMHDPVQRARILHGCANHELQAIELFAWALLVLSPWGAPAPNRIGAGDSDLSSYAVSPDGVRLALLFEKEPMALWRLDRLGLDDEPLDAGRELLRASLVAMREVLDDGAERELSVAEWRRLRERYDR